MDTIVPVGGITHGYAHIGETSEFKLNTQFGFRGRLTLDATEKLGFYDGEFAMLAFEEPAVIEVVELDVACIDVKGRLDWRCRHRHALYQ